MPIVNPEDICKIEEESEYVAPSETITIKKKIKINSKVSTKSAYSTYINQMDFYYFKVCEICDKTFATNYKLTEHMRSHSTESPFKCSHEGCNKSFRSKIGRTQHEAKHTGIKNIAFLSIILF